MDVRIRRSDFPTKVRKLGSALHIIEFESVEHLDLIDHLFHSSEENGGFEIFKNPGEPILTLDLVGDEYIEWIFVKTICVDTCYKVFLCIFSYEDFHGMKQEPHR